MGINTSFAGIIRATASGYGAIDLIIPGMDKSHGLQLLLTGGDQPGGPGSLWGW
ncbi:MAG: hypothetical protein ACLSH6_09880 [Limosilactobacillus pontis]